MQVQVDASDIMIVRRLWEKAGKDAPEAVQQTINRVGPLALTQVRRALVKQVGLPYGRIKREVNPARWATVSNPTFDIRSLGRQIPLREFGAKQLRAGVRASPWGVTRTFAGTFMADTPGGGVRDVWKRTRVGPDGSVRTYYTELPIKKLYGPAIPNEMVKGASLAVFQKTARDRLPAEAATQVAKILGKGRLADRRKRK
jgi:hypothetical protein